VISRSVREIGDRVDHLGGSGPVVVARAMELLPVGVEIRPTETIADGMIGCLAKGQAVLAAARSNSRTRA
jgi:hypothetical protein